MNKPPVRRLIRKFAILGVLILCLGIFSFGSSESRAAVCCSACDVNFDNCYESCGDPPSGACIFFCERMLNRCQSTCNPDC